MLEFRYTYFVGCGWKLIYPNQQSRYTLCADAMFLAQHKFRYTYTAACVDMIYFDILFSRDCGWIL